MEKAGINNKTVNRLRVDDKTEASCVYNRIDTIKGDFLFTFTLKGDTLCRFRNYIGFQFFLSVGMLISTLFIYKQIHYMFTADTGVDRKNIIILDTSLWYQAEDFIQIIKRENSNIIDATIASGAPYDVGYSYSGVSWEGSTDAIKEVEIGHIFCDYHYVNTFGLQVISGEFIQPGWTWWQYEDKKSYNIGIACAIAIPVSFIILYRWIQAYAFRTSLSWWIFVFVPLSLSIITAAIIAVQIFFATRRNPAEVIKLE